MYCKSMNYILVYWSATYGVPTNVLLLKELAAATPKSHNCTFPSAVKRMFAANNQNSKRYCRLPTNTSFYL